ncbi:sensor domain-containing diguanylate cyclase [Pokkaliibacter plantistimulans]|nr:sensor domain-containing diguanylate cyclase [Pokkaliibacter plantistimulans]
MSTVNLTPFSRRAARRLNLRTLILSLCLLTVLLTLAISLYASYTVQRQLLIQTTLEANRVYASKLAESTNLFMTSAIDRLSYSAHRLSGQLHNAGQLQDVVDRIRLDSNRFNSTIIVAADGEILAYSPQKVYPAGQHVASPESLAALRQRALYISEPFTAPSGRLIIFIAQPIITADGQYQGYVAGTIYLQEHNALDTLLGEHPYKDGSNLYVVDEQGRLIYHSQSQRVGEYVERNPVVSELIQGNSGSQQVNNTQGTSMLAGFAMVPTTRWGIVAQRPMASVTSELNHLMFVTVRNALPLLLVALLLIGWLTRLITRPLHQLAQVAHHLDDQQALHHTNNVRDWYAEAGQLKRAMQTGLRMMQHKIDRLSQESLTDPLTGLVNRRGLEQVLAQWSQNQQRFTLIMLDIDHFKRVNDAFGHDVGDLVLCYIADQLRQHSRAEDICCRCGGEEFMMLLPDVSAEQALAVAERLRLQVAGQNSPAGQPVTLSLGLAQFPETATAVVPLLKQVDLALYAAKHAGRNQTMAAQPAP